MEITGMSKSLKKNKQMQYCRLNDINPNPFKQDKGRILRSLQLHEFDAPICLFCNYFGQSTDQKKEQTFEGHLILNNQNPICTLYFVQGRLLYCVDGLHPVRCWNRMAIWRRFWGLDPEAGDGWSCVREIRVIRRGRLGHRAGFGHRPGADPCRPRGGRARRDRR